MKELKDMSFSEVVDIAKQEILLDLIKGNFGSAVRLMMEFAIRWKEAQEN